MESSARRTSGSIAYEMAMASRGVLQYSFWGAPYLWDVAAGGKFWARLGIRTERDCPEPEGVMDQAEAYFSTLIRMERFRVSGDRLEVLDSGGAGRLVFVRQARRAIPLTCRAPNGEFVDRGAPAGLRSELQLAGRVSGGATWPNGTTVLAG